MRTSVAAILICLLLAAPVAAEPAATPTPLWIPNGQAGEVLLSGDTAFVGGRFTRVGPYTGAFVRVNQTSGELREGRWPEVAGSVTAAAADGAGGWYVGGDFLSVGGVRRRNLAHILADGTVDPAFDAVTDKGVDAVLLRSGVLYAGGRFDQANGQPRSRLAAFDAATGDLAPFVGTVTGTSVDALAIAGTQESPKLYVGGRFTQANSTARNNLASFSLPEGALQAFNPNVNGPVHSLTSDGLVLYLGGRFSQVQGTARRNVAAVNASSGALESFNFAAGSSNQESVLSLALSGPTLYVGGVFGSPRQHLAAVNAATGALTAFNAGLDTFATVSALAVSGSTVYAGGAIHQVGGSATREQVAAFDATTGAATAWDPRAGGHTRFLAASGGDVLIGGNFATIGGVARENLAAISLATGRPTEFSTGVDGEVRGLAASDGNLYVAGPFQNAGGQPRQGMASMNAATGALRSFAPALGLNVVALAARGSTVYAGGLFTEANGSARVNLAALQDVEGTAGALTPFRADMTGGMVNALEVVGDTVYVGGEFTAPRRFLAAADAQSGALRPFDPNPAQGISALTSVGPAVVAGGAGVVTPFNLTTDGFIWSLDALDGAVYVGGSFATVGPSARRPGLAAVDETTGALHAWAPELEVYTGTPGTVTSVSASPEGGVVAAGFFWLDTEGARVAHLAAFPVPPRPPSDVTAAAGNGQATVGFATPPRGGAPITSYTVTASPGGASASGSASPLTVSGLANGTPYSFTVTATNRAGTSPPSAASAAVTPAAPGSTADVEPPRVTEFRASRKRLRAGKKRTPSTGAARPAAKKRPGRGTTLTLGLSEAAAVRFDVLAELKGRRAGARCRKPGRANRRGKKCVRLVRRARFTRTAPAGRSRVAFTARLTRRALKPGRYRLTATPTDAAGNTGKARAVRIRVVR
jgi:hypothetical protein